MSQLVKKEIRLLLPAWIAAMGLAVFPAWILILALAIDPGLNDWISSPDTLGFLLLIFSLGILILGVTSFGQELISGTFTILLSQPTERTRIWRVKITVLAVAFITVWLAAIIFIHSAFLVFAWSSRYGAPLTMPAVYVIEFLTLTTITAFSGGLWTTLLLRQTTGAFWFTLLTPLALFLGITLIGDYWEAFYEKTGIITVIVLSLYSIATFFWARKLFLRAQDIQWTGGEFVFPWRKKIAPTEAISTPGRPRHWLPSLVWKEIQLHQANLFIAAIILVLHLSAICVHKIHPHFDNPDVQFVFESIWLLWLLMPLLIGCAAIAEERRIGTFNSQLCLPVSRRAQLLVKFFTTLALSLALGAALPVCIERMGQANASAVFIFVASMFFISFYASSIARSTLQAIGLAIAWVALLFASEAATAFDGLLLGVRNQIGFELLKIYLGVPILLLVLAWLILWNFKWLHETRKLLWRNSITVLAAFASIFVLSNVIYFRMWEFLSPLEPPRGPAYLANSSELKSSGTFNALYAVLPDGRLWTKTLSYNFISNRWFEADILVPARSHAQFIGGSNWVDVTSDYFQALGVQSNGTLWSLQRKWNSSQRYWAQTGPFILTQIGSDSDWSQVAGRSMGFLVLKKDGSLWTWGTNAYDGKDLSNSIPQKLKLDLTTLPVHIGGESKYARLFSPGRGSAFAAQDDGTMWRWTTWEETNYISRLAQDTNFNGQWKSLTSFDDSFIGVKTNGELWYILIRESSSRKSYKTYVRRIPLGWHAKWTSATTANWNRLLAVRADGTLWEWDDLWNRVDNRPVQLGTHSDWIAPINSWESAIAIAADGSIWAWDQPSSHIWLAPSRRPLYVGNIFESSPDTAP